MKTIYSTYKKIKTTLYHTDNSQKEITDCFLLRYFKTDIFPVALNFFFVQVGEIKNIGCGRSPFIIMSHSANKE